MSNDTQGSITQIKVWQWKWFMLKNDNVPRHTGVYSRTWDHVSHLQMIMSHDAWESATQAPPWLKPV